MDSLTLFGHLFKTPCEAICIFLDFFTEKRGSHRGIYDFFRKSHETHCIRRKFSIYCNKNCSGNMRILCPFAETTYTPPGDENFAIAPACIVSNETTYPPVRGRKRAAVQPPKIVAVETTHTPSGDENRKMKLSRMGSHETTHTPPGDENVHRIMCSLPSGSKQLTPRQGTKTQLVTPRQGTKTLTLSYI